MSSHNKEITIIDPHLISGSGDRMRDALGLSIDGSPDTVFLNLDTFDKTDASSQADGIVNKYTYFYRIRGNGNNLINDKQWKSYVVGGDFLNTTLSGIYSEANFSDHYHSEIVPYSLSETKVNGTFDTSTPNYISIQPVINSYHQSYSDFTNTVTSLTEIVNCYRFTKKYILPMPTNPVILRDKESALTDIFKFGIPNQTFESEQVSDLQQNLFFVNPEVYETVDTLNSGAKYIPQLTKIEMDFEDTGQFIKDCVSNGFEYLFLRTLKETILQQDGAPTLENISFTVDSSFIDADGNNSETITSATLTAVDVFQMMDYALKNYNTETQDFEFLLDISEQAQSQYDNTSVRRLEKTIPALRQFQSLTQLLESSNYTNTFINDPISVQNKYNEVVAYRVEKVFGSDTVQNFWFLNIEDVESFSFNDNQIAYGRDYTYNIYKYVLIAGTDYQYSNIRLSRVLGKNLGLWGLEIYDPATDEAIEPLYPSNSISNDLSTDAQIQSAYKYVADFQVDVTPSVKIVEVQIFSKVVSILDAPTNNVSVVPSYVLDNSRRLQFEVRYDLIDNNSFPSVMNSTEEDYKQRFLNSYDLLEDEQFMIHAMSLASTIEVYRIDFKPTSISDFDQKLIITESLKIANEDAAFTSKTIFDKVATNKKYYYYFRIINEARTVSYGSRIYEAELVDDGGYKFAVFNVYFESDLEMKPFNRPIESFKKLINIVPNIENVIINDEDVDYSDVSENQIENVKFGQSEDPVWDKTFKIRLTSKKTGKKIDINLTHKVV